VSHQTQLRCSYSITQRPLSCRVTPDPPQQPCEYHSPEQSPHSGGEEILFKWNKAQTIQAPPSKQDLCVPGAGQHLTHTSPKQRGQEVRGYLFTHTSFSCFRSSSGSSPAESTSRTRSHQLADGEPALLLSANQAEECWALPAPEEHRQYWLVTAPSSL